MLCNKCQKFDLDGLLPRKNVITGHHLFHETLDSLRASSSNGCSFCQLVVQIFERDTPSNILEKLRGKEVFIGIPPTLSDWRISEKQGNSELVAYCGLQKILNRGDFDRPFQGTGYLRTSAIARFALCVERSPKEWRTGQS
jgi:hypothetical protein